MNDPITSFQILKISIAILLVVAILAGLFEIPNLRKRGAYKEQEQQAHNWERAEATRRKLGLSPTKYDQSAFDDYHTDPPTETQGENMHRILRRNYQEPREEFTHLKK